MSCVCIRMKITICYANINYNNCVRHSFNGKLASHINDIEQKTLGCFLNVNKTLNTILHLIQVKKFRFKSVCN